MVFTRIGRRLGKYLGSIRFSLTIISNYEIIDETQMSTLKRLIGMFGVKVVLGIRAARYNNSFFDNEYS